MEEPATLDTVSLIRGGALYRFQEGTRLIRPNQWNTGRRIFIAVLVGWVPLVALTAMGGSHASLLALLKDYRVFARVFIAVPLLIAGQKLIEERFRLIVRHSLVSGLLKPEDAPKFREILATIRRLKDAWFPELAVVAFGCVGGILLVGNDLMSDASWVRAYARKLSLSVGGWLVFRTGNADHLHGSSWPRTLEMVAVRFVLPASFPTASAVGTVRP